MIDPASRLRLEDMREHARLAVEILGDATAEVLRTNAEKRLAVIRAIEVIGEAANRVDPAFRQSEPLVPWKDIVAMRHRLVHGYAPIDLERLVQTINEDMAPLLVEHERLLNPGT
jgi:uncharacterized protein with HEPN domain